MLRRQLAYPRPSMIFLRYQLGRFAHCSHLTSSYAPLKFTPYTKFGV